MRIGIQGELAAPGRAAGPNAQYWPYAHLLSALGHLGDADQIAAARAELLHVKPDFSLTFAREHLFYLKREDQFAIYLTGLQKAGLA